MARTTGRKEVDVTSEAIGQKDGVDIGELGSELAIDKVAETDGFAVDNEAFMNEILTIIVHQDNAEGALDVITPCVNGRNQPIIRGAQSKVKRKYVEVLARTRTDTYTQVQTNPQDRASLRMVPRSVITYPFSVINDPNPNGREWLEEIMRQPQ